MKRPIVAIAVSVLLVLGLYLVWDQGTSSHEEIDVDGQAVAGDEQATPGPDRSGTAGEGGVRQRWMPAGRAFTASIVDLDERPVIGLKLALGREPDLQSVETDEHGGFTFRPGTDAAERIEIVVQDSKWMLVDWMDRKRLESLALPTDRARVIKLRVHPMLVLAGRVLDENGEVAAGAQILMDRSLSWRGELLPASRTWATRTWNEMMSTEISDGQGRFRIAMPTGAPVLGVKARTESAQESEVQDLAAWWKNPDCVITLRLQRLGKLRGKILFVGIKKPKYVTVALRRKQKPAERSDQGSMQARLPRALQSFYTPNAQDREFTQLRRINETLDRGYLLEGLLPGTYQVHFSYYDHAARSKVEEVSVLPGATRTLDVTFGPEVAEPTTELTGSVVDGEGRGIDGMRVHAWETRARVPGTSITALRRPFGASVLTDAQGRFAITTPEDMQIRLATSTQAKRTGPFTVFDVVHKTVKAGTKEVRLQVPSRMAGVIQGRILFPNGKMPATGDAVVIRLESRGVHLRQDSKIGTFAIRHVPPGEHQITARSQDFGFVSKTVSVTAEQVTPVILQFEAPQDLRGQVVDGKGHPVGGVGLWVNLGFEAVSAGAFANPAATTGKAGRFEIPGSGKWGSISYRQRAVYILAYKKGHAPLTRLVKSAQDARQLRLVLRREGSLYVRHLPVNGRAFGLSFDKAVLYHLNLKFIDPVTRKLSDVMWRSYTPGKPNIHFPKIPAGNYQLLLQALPPKHKKDQPIPSLWRRVSVKPGDVTTVDWRELYK